MKKTFILTILSAAMMLVASCQKTIVTNEKENGYLSFSEFSLGLDETVITKATAANGTIVKAIDGKTITIVADSSGKLTVLNVA